MAGWSVCRLRIIRRVDEWAQRSCEGSIVMRSAIRAITTVLAVVITIMAAFAVIRGVRSNIPEKAHLWKIIAGFLGVLLSLIGVISLLKRNVRTNHKYDSRDSQ